MEPLPLSALNHHLYCARRAFPVHAKPGVTAPRDSADYDHTIDAANLPTGINNHRKVWPISAQLDYLSSWAQLSTMSTSLTIGEFKARLPEALALVEKGETVTVTYGRNKRPVAVFGPPPTTPLSPRVPGRFAGQFRVPDGLLLDPLTAPELADWETNELIPPAATKPSA